MLTLEQQYPSVDRCKKLKDIGFPQGFFHMEYIGINYSPLPQLLCVEYRLGLGENINERYAAPSVPEMLELMPKTKILQSSVLENEYDSWEYEVSTSKSGYFYSNDLANAVADCLIWLIQNNFISFNN